MRVENITLNWMVIVAFIEKLTFEQTLKEVKEFTMLISDGNIFHAKRKGHAMSLSRALVSINEIIWVG